MRESIPTFCHSERSEESLLLLRGLNQREIPRFARNDKMNYFFRRLKPALQFIHQCLSKIQ